MRISDWSSDVCSSDLRSQQLASMVHVTPEGTIYAFIAGSGLLKAEEPGFQWTPVSNDFGGALVLHLAAGKGDETQRRLYVVTLDPEIGRGKGRERVWTYV